MKTYVIFRSCAENMIETVILSLDLVLLKRGGWRSGANGHKSVIKKARISLVVFEIAWRHPGTRW